MGEGIVYLDADNKKIYRYIFSIVKNLNLYMVEKPEIVLDKQKRKNLLDERNNLDNTLFLEIAAIYGAILKWKYADDRSVKNLIQGCNEFFPMVSKEIAADWSKKTNDRKADLSKLTEHLVGLMIETNVKRINSSLGKFAPSEMVDAIIGDVLNTKFNQMVTDYNRTLLSESLNRVLIIMGNIKR